MACASSSQRAPEVAVEQLAPFAAAVKQRYPDLVLEILAAVEHVDLNRGTAELAIRIRQPNEAELVTLCHPRAGIGVFTSRRYAATVPKSCSWADLDWITWRHPYESVAPRPMLEKAMPGFHPAFASDDYLVQKSALYQGLGATIIGRPMASSAADADLVEIDVGVKLPDSDFHLVCARSLLPVPRVRAVAELLTGTISRYFR